MNFREYTSSDIEAMVQLDALCFAEAFQFDRSTMRQFAEQPGAIVFLYVDGSPAEEQKGIAAEKPAQLAAFVIVHLEARGAYSRAYVVTLDVAPSSRRRGIGSAMLDRAEAAARTAGATHITLHVAADNGAAIALYQRQLYRRSGVARRFYREAGQDAIIFMKPL